MSNANATERSRTVTMWFNTQLIENKIEYLITRDVVKEEMEILTRYFI